MKKAQVVIFSLLAAWVYGIVHDQITVRLAIEYFSVAHPPIFRTTNPTLLGFCWAIAATSGIGIALGSILALVSQSDGAAPVPLSEIRRSLLRLIGMMACASLLAGAVGFYLSRLQMISIASKFDDLIPIHKHDRFVAVWFMHLASYIAGFGGGALLCYRVWKERGRPAVLKIFPNSPAATIRAALIVGAAAYIMWIRFGSL